MFMLRVIRLSFPVFLLASIGFIVLAFPAPQQDEPLPGARPYSQFAPYYTVGEGFGARLMLSNSTRTGYSVKPTLYSLDGTGAEMPLVHLNAHETKEIDIGQWVAGLGERYVTGSLRLDYQSVGSGLGAIVMMVNERHSLELDVLARLQPMFRSNQLEAIWWVPDGKAQIRFAVQNTTSERVTGTLSLTDTEGNLLKSVVLDSPPHSTRLFRLGELIEGEVPSLGGISMRHDGRPGALMAQAFVVTRHTGFSANLPFEDPGTFGDSKLEGAGILLGSERSVVHAPSFSGHLLARNISPDPVVVTAELQRGNVQTQVGEFTLRPGEAREILVPADALPEQPAATGIQISHTGPPGALLGYWFSTDESGDLVVETPLRSPAPNAHGAGTNPWNLQGDSSSVLYIKNTGAEKGAAVVNLWYPGGEYMIGLRTIEPGQTEAIDIRKLRDDQLPDVHGHRLPPHLASGQILWTWHDGPPLVGRVNTMSVSKGIASNMSCPSCCECPSSVSVSLVPASSVGGVGSGFQEVPWEIDSNNCGTRSFPVPASWLT